MTEWKRICCAVELSEASRIAMLKAAEVAARFGGELVLLHVRPIPLAAGGDLLATAGDLGGLEAPEVEGAMALWRDEAARISGRPARAVVRTGEPATEIVRFAREWACDALVIATHARKGLARFVLGSVAEKVVRGAPCTVIVARRPEPSAARARADETHGAETALAETEA